MSKYDPYHTRLQNDMRNILLAETDWYAIRAFEQNVPIPDEILTYRQALRDISLQDEYPYNVQWPDKPRENYGLKDSDNA